MKACGSTIEMDGGAWRHVRGVAFDTDYCGCACGRVRTSLAVGLPRLSRLAKDDLSGTCRKLIGAIFKAVMRKAVVFAVWDSSTAVSAGSELKDDSWKTSEVQRREAVATTVTVEAMLRMK